jgi:hypothetical protein
MKIDRSPSLAFFAALVAAAGCHVYVNEPAQSPSTTPSPAPAPAPAPAPQGAAPGAKVAPLKLHTAGGATPAPSGMTPAPAPAPAPAACLDTGATTVGDCAAIAVPAGCTAAPTIQQKCNAFKTYFSPKVAAAAVSCLAALPASQACDATHTSACARTALAQACPAAALGQLCQIAATPCKTTATDCTATLSGLSDQGQQAVAQCVAQGCTAGLAACIDALAASTAASAKR